MEETNTNEVVENDNQTEGTSNENNSNNQANNKQDNRDGQTMVEELSKLLSVKIQGLTETINNQFIALADELHKRLNIETPKAQQETQEVKPMNSWKVF